MKSWPFFSYFFTYILRAKTRQRLLFIAVVGLFLSAFSLMVIQGIMGGLQKGLVSRSKSINGSYILKFKNPTSESLLEIKEILEKNQNPFFSELEIEVMLKKKNFMAPAKIHGIDLNDPIPTYLYDKDMKGMIMANELSSKIQLKFMEEFQVIVPGVTDSLMGEIPRFGSSELTDFIYTEIPEVDEFETWVRVEFVQNLIRQRGINQIRIFGDVPQKLKQELLAVKTEVPFEWVTWEEMNGALVWSLNLETKVMLFLFISMTFLVAIAITSGFLIFFSKIQRDLMSFWILGMGQKKILQLTFRFTLMLSAVTTLLGGFFGFVALRLLESYGHDIMPDIFVERQLPVQVSISSVCLSILIPFTISFVFSWFSFAAFRRENQSFVSIVRSLS
jgi:lipoprotein-releasing system permease protein